MKITIDSLNKYYCQNHVLKNINLVLENGVYGLVGPNGVGKTTLLHIILSILKYDSGTFTISNDVKHGSDSFISTIGYLPQYPEFYPAFSAYDFLKYMCILKDIASDSIEDKVRELLEKVNLSDDRNTLIKAFSGGMRQRLGIAQALINNPQLLVLDEPTAGLDPKERIRFRNIISQLSKDRIVIFSSHIISDIEYIADEIILLKDGVIIKKDKQDNILAEIEGSIQELVVSETELDDLATRVIITRIREVGDQFKIRIISNEDLGKNVPANIEDIYMYYFGDINEKNDVF